MAKGSYYFGRLTKTGINQQDLIEAITKSAPIKGSKFKWAITDVEDKSNGTIPYVFGYLTKYINEGEVATLDEPEKKSFPVHTPNQIRVAIPFVYLPEHSGLVFLNVDYQVSEKTFRKKFCEIITSYFDNYFVEVKIEIISDYKSFLKKLKDLSFISSIVAKVVPPNPLFGRLWKDLNDYVKRRKASEVKISEKTNNNEGLVSKIVGLINSLLEDPSFEPDEKPDIADSAILMAADGYGWCKISGKQSGTEVIIRTSDTKKAVVFEKEPMHEELAKLANDEFKKIEQKRGHEHL